MADWDAYFDNVAPKKESGTDWDAYFDKPKEHWIRSELFPVKREETTGALKLAYPGFVKDIVGGIQAAEKTPYAYDPTTGEVHVSPEMQRAGAKVAIAGLPFAPETEAAAAAMPAVSRLQRIGKEGTRPLFSEEVKQQVIEPLRKAWEAPQRLEETAARAEQMQKEAGAGMQAAKEGTAPVPAIELKPVVEQIKKDIKPTYYKSAHPSTKAALSQLRDLLPKEEEVPFYPPRNPALQRKVTQAGGAPTAIERARLEAKIRQATGQEPEKTVSVMDLHDIQRGPIKNMAKSADEPERLSAYKMREHLDNFITDRMMAGPWTKLKARYAGASAALEMKELFDLATLKQSQFSRGRLGTAITTKFRQLASNPNRMRMYERLSPGAANRINELAKGGPVLDQILGRFASMAPTSITPIILDEIGGRLFHHLIPGGAPTLMVGGALMKWFSGRRAINSISDIMDEFMAAAEKGKVEDIIGTPAAEAIRKSPEGAKNLEAFSRARGRTKRAAARALALSVARITNMPQLVPRIENEINPSSDEGDIEPVSN